MSFHKSKKWKEKRKAILRRDEYLCRECRRYGRTRLATTVHHIIPIDQRPDLALASKNLISLCTECHNKMHDRDSGELTELGKRWAEKVSPLP